MKLDKKKITFIAVIGAVVIFIITYSLLAFGEDDSQKEELQQTQVPVLENPIDDYTSRLDAVDDLKEVRQTNAPSIYDEKYLDSTGVFDPDFLEKEKIRMVDSIYNNSRINYTTGTLRATNPVRDSVVNAIAKKQKTQKKEVSPLAIEISPKALALEQQLFFASNPLPIEETINEPSIEVMIDKKQVIKVNDRLQMRTLHNVEIEGRLIPKNTTLFGMVSFKPNRVLLQIENIDNVPLSFKAYDFRDRLEGIYVKNSFREELRQQVLGDVVDDINVPGVPQVTGFKRLFQRSNRQVKVTVNPNYKLIIKVDAQQ
ncbi:conjugative transposon protein TraM [Flagellimonas sp. CMM7]|uniref:conjugative transposon protein TraM n=1 Tax=Flagellimonas sp. CMM7 TaxID=2654676 RepID=UPI0013D3D66A|nr:conjugative transposon protein TraM [Flagellimonas sp. CMM7]UII80103.1 conjugative transposon protein TraM [Flagellimonas sp. CMM7]